MVTVSEWNNWEVRAVLRKWDDEDDWIAQRDPAVSRFGKPRLGDGLITNLGGTRMWRLIRGDANFGDNTLDSMSGDNSYLGVGCDATNSSSSLTAAAVAQTDLIASGGPGAFWLSCDAGGSGGYPAVQGDTAVNAPTDPRDVAVTATFGANQGNLDYSGPNTGNWLEFGVAIDAAGSDGQNGLTGTGVMLDRFVSDQGRKVAGQVWELTVTLGFREAA